MRERLYRSTRQKVIGGVCGGLGDYLNIDPVIVRVVFILLTIFNGVGILVYLVMWAVIPVERDNRPNVDFKDQKRSQTEGDSFTIVDENETKQDESKTETGKNEFTIEEEKKEESKSSMGRIVIGGALILFGTMFLAERFFCWFSFSDFMPTVLILIGLALLWNSIRK